MFWSRSFLHVVHVGSKCSPVWMRIHDMSKAVSRTPLSQIHGNGKACPWSSMDVHTYRRCQPQRPPPSWMTASSPSEQTAHPTLVLLSPCLHFFIRITPVLIRSILQLLQAGAGLLITAEMGGTESVCGLYEEQANSRPVQWGVDHRTFMEKRN